LRDIERTIRQTVPVKEHELGIAGVAELAPMHGWDPTAKRKSGGGRHMPKAAKKPHRGQGGNQKRTDQPKREWMPTQPIDQSQFAKLTHEEQRKPAGERLRHERPHAERQPSERHERPDGERKHAERPHGERKHADRAHAERGHGERSHGARPHGDRKPSGKPNRGPQKGNRPQGQGHGESRGQSRGNANNWMKAIGRGNTP
jgi:hypothetical protein